MKHLGRPARICVAVILFVLCGSISALADDGSKMLEKLITAPDDSCNQGTGAQPPTAYYFADMGTKQEYSYEPAPQMPPEPQKAPPLPLHTIEGVGGGLSVPLAYLVNPGPEGTVVSMPAVSATYLNTNKKKDLMVLAITETFWRRVEVGYALARFYMGNLPHVIKKKTGLDTDLNDLWLHNFNARGLILEENTFGPWCPSVVVGLQFKWNASMHEFNHDLMGVPASLGYDKSNGVDYVLTASKTVPPDVLGLPLIFTFGLRNSRASNLGLTGFGKDSSTTVEFDAVAVLTKNFAVAYEFRQKEDPFHSVPGIFDREENWHAARVAWIINDRATLAGGLAYLGNVGNTHVPFAWGLQFKYEF